jgi:hypothetical protein
MGVSVSIIRTPVILVVLVLVACIGLSAYVTNSALAPTVDKVVDYGIRKYDEIFPEITIRNGKASITKQQPYLVDKIDEKYFSIIIDTRDGQQAEAMNYLKNVDAGLVLTQDAVVTKNNGQIRIIPLKGMPNIVLNAALLRDIADKYLPLVKPAIAIGATIYFAIVKTIQMLIFALIPFLWARRSRIAVTYGQAVKLSVFGMAAPVLLGAISAYSGIKISGWFYIYFGLYAGLMILAAGDLVKSMRASTEPSFEIQM